MSLKSKTFFISKGDSLDQVTYSLEREVGLDAYLIRDLQAISTNELNTELTVLYQKYDDSIISSVAPREGGIFTTGVATDGNFDVRFLFSHPVDPNSFTSGAVIADSNELSSNRYYIDTGCNNYFVKVNLSGLAAEQFHDYRINNSKVKRYDGSIYPYSFVAGYTIHNQSSAHLGDRTQPLKLRGKLKADIIRVQKSFSSQQAISEFLSNKNLTTQFLIAYTTVSKTQGMAEIYLIYISDPEPQVVQGFPLTHSLFPDIAAPPFINLVFSTKLDVSQFSSVNGLFHIESSFNTSIPVAASDISVLSDGKTVRINTSSYFTSQKIYSIIARPGIKSDRGFVKVKPDQWVIHVNKYEGQSIVTGSGSGAPLDASYLVSSANGTLTNERVLSAVNGLTTITVGGSSFVLSGLPASTTTPGVVSFNSQWFSGNAEGKFSLVESGITHNNLIGVGSNSHSQIDTAITTASAHFSNTSNPHSTTASQVGAPTNTEYLGLSGTVVSHTTNTSNPHSTTASQVGAPTTAMHAGLSGAIVNATGNIAFISGNLNTTNSNLASASGLLASTTGNVGSLSGRFSSHSGDTTVHFTQSQISIPSSQISDFTESVQDTIGSASFLSFGSGITGTYNDAGGTLNLSGVYATTARHGVSMYSSQFSITNGVVTMTGTVASPNSQPANAHLTGLSNLSPSGNLTTHRYLYYTGTNLPTTGDLSSFMRTVLDDSSASVARSTLGLTIGSAVQEWNADLDALAAVSPAAGRMIIANLSNAWTRLDAGSPGALLMIDPDGIPTWLEPGSENQTLRMAGGFPTWSGP